MYKIKIIGTEENKDDGFYAIITSGESSGCLEDEMYAVNDRTIEKLRQEKVKFEIIREP